MSVIELKDISYVRGGNTILSGISWRIERGQHWALIGANGSGKTSLLKVVTGYEWPTRGEVFVLGQHFGDCDLRELRKAVGWVSSAIEHQLPIEDTALRVAVSGFDASIGIYREMSETEWERARRALDQVGMRAYADRPYRLLSQGEQQRVLIARALVNDPSLMILDEPCAGLDPAARDNFLDDLEKLSQQPNAPTTIVVTHHIEEIGPWITHVLILKSGQPLAQGRTRDVLSDSTLTAAFGRKCILISDHDRFRLRFELGIASVLPGEVFRLDNAEAHE